MMFSSASSCIPESLVSVDFVSLKDQVLDISIDVTITVNGEIISDRPINLLIGDRVKAEVVSPLGYLQYQFYEYFLDGQKHHFAVVNKSYYAPTVKTADVPKKWFNYNVSDLRISFYDPDDAITYPIGFAKNFVDIQSSHIVLDHINNTVGFYGVNHNMITMVTLPGGPIEYKKFSYQIPQTDITTTDVLVLCSNRRLYRIRFDNRYSDNGEFTPTVIPLFNLGNLWFDQDMPTGESFIEFRRQRLLNKLSPVLTAIDIGNNYIWLAGYDSIFILSKSNFSLLNTIKINFGTIISICAINNDAIATTRDGKVLYINYAGTVTTLHTTRVLGMPSSINNNTAVAVPDPDNRYILIFEDDTGNYTTWNTEDFAPAYAREFEGQLWVTGHDNNTVLRFNSPTDVSKFSFENKVTTVSVVGKSILATHYLQNVTTLNLDGVEKIISMSFETKKGPMSHVGSEPNRVTMIGQEGILPKTSPGLTCWTNGIINEPTKTGDYVGVSYRGEAVGKFRSVLILGETAIDYDVEIAETPAEFKCRNFTPKVITSDQISTTTVIVYIDQDIELESNILVSATFGYLSVNNASYYGKDFITKSSFITLKVPFNDSLRAIAPILSIGTHQIAIPIKSSINSQTELESLLPSNITSLTDLLPNVVVNGSLIIPVTDSYFIPDYYRVSTDPNIGDINFTLIRETEETVLTKGFTYDLMAGDEVFVSNIVTSPSIHDKRQTLLVGSFVTGLSWQTAGPPLIDTLTFDTLVEPFKSNNEYILIDGIVYDVGYRLYESSIATITSSSAITCNLYVNNSNAGMIIDGNTVNGYYAIDVPISSTISLTRNITDFFQEAINLYQVFYDNEISSNVYISVGNWDIQNKYGTSSDLDTKNLVLEDINSSIIDEQNLLHIAITPESLADLYTQLGIKISALNVKFTEILKEISGFVSQSQDAIIATPLSVILEKYNDDLKTGQNFLSFQQISLFDVKLSIENILEKFKQTVISKNLSVELIPGTYGQNLVASSEQPVLLSGASGSSLIVGDIFDSIFVPERIISTQQDYLKVKNNTYKNTLFNVRIINDQTPVSNKNTLFNVRIINDQTPVSDRSSLFTKKIINNQIPVSDRSSLFTKKIINDWVPATDRITLTNDRIINNQFPDTSKRTVFSARIINDQVPATDRTTVVNDRIINNQFPDTSKRTVFSARIINDWVPASYKRTVVVNAINNETIPESNRKTVVTTRINNDRIPESYKRTVVNYQIINNQVTESFGKTVISGRYRAVELPESSKKTLISVHLISDQIPENFGKTIISSSIKSNQIPENFGKTIINGSIKNKQILESSDKSLVFNRLYSDYLPTPWLSKIKLKSTSSISPTFVKFKKDSSLIPETQSKTLVKNRLNQAVTFRQNLVLLKTTATIPKKSTAIGFEFNSKILNPFSSFKNQQSPVTGNGSGILTSKLSIQAPKNFKLIYAKWNFIRTKENLYDFKNKTTIDFIGSYFFNKTLFEISSTNFYNDRVKIQVDKYNEFTDRFDINRDIDVTLLTTKNKSVVDLKNEMFLALEKNLIVNHTEVSSDNPVEVNIDNLSSSKLDSEVDSNKKLLINQLEKVREPLYNIIEYKNKTEIDLTEVIISKSDPVAYFNPSLLNGTLDLILDLNNLLKSRYTLDILLNPAGSITQLGVIIDSLSTAYIQLQSLISGTESSLLSKINETMDSTASQINSMLIRIDGVYTQILKTLDSYNDVASMVQQPLTLIDDVLTAYTVNSLPPLMDAPTQINQPLDPMLDQPTRIFKLLDILKDEATTIFKPMVVKLDEDQIWVSGELNKTGAYTTLIQVYADDGRGGDKVTNRGHPPSNLPFVLYSKEYNYGYGSYLTFGEAQAAADKYASATPIPIVDTNYWNYRIYFNNKHYCVPKKGLVFPVKWYIRGG